MPEGLPKALASSSPAPAAPAPMPKAAAPSAPPSAPKAAPIAPSQPAGDSSAMPAREEAPIAPPSPMKGQAPGVPEGEPKPGRKGMTDVEFEESLRSDLEENPFGDEEAAEMDSQIDLEEAEGGAPPAEGGEQAPAEEAPPQAETFRVGDMEYTAQQIEDLAQAQRDWETMNNFMVRNPQFKQYWDRGMEKMRRGEALLPEEQPQAKAPDAPPAPLFDGPSDEDLLAQMPEDFRGPGKALLQRQAKLAEHFQKQIAERDKRIAQYEQIANDNLLDKEWTDLQSFTKQNGLVPPDEMRVIQESRSRGDISLKDAYLASYFEENMLRMRKGQGGAAGAAQPSNPEAPAAAAAGTNGNGQGAAKPPSRPIPRPANPARPTARPPAKPFGKMTGPESEQALLYHVRRMEKTGKW